MLFFNRTISILILAVYLAVLFSHYAMAVVVWQKADNERKKGVVYITNSDAADSYSNENLEQLIEDSFADLSTHSHDCFGNSPSKAPIGIDAHTKAYYFSGKVCRYMDISWNTFLKLFPDQGLFDLKF